MAGDNRNIVNLEESFLVQKNKQEDTDTINNFIARNIAMNRFNKIILEESDFNDTENDDLNDPSDNITCYSNFELCEKWDYGTSGFLSLDKKWCDPSRIFKMGHVEKLENFLVNLKLLHPKQDSNAYLARSGFLPSKEVLETKHPKGSTYICFNFTISSERQRGFGISDNGFYLLIKGLILSLVAQNYPKESNKAVYESICCIESLCKVHRSSKNRKSFSLKIWKLNEFSTFTVLDHIIKIFTSKELQQCLTIQYFANVVKEMLEIVNKFEFTLGDSFERHIQRNKFQKMSEDELASFKSRSGIDDNTLSRLTHLLNNPLVGIKIKNYFSS
jgi:hypothetical protein